MVTTSVDKAGVVAEVVVESARNVARTGKTSQKLVGARTPFEGETSQGRGQKPSAMVEQWLHQGVVARRLCRCRSSFMSRTPRSSLCTSADGGVPHTNNGAQGDTDRQA